MKILFFSEDSISDITIFSVILIQKMALVISFLISLLISVLIIYGHSWYSWIYENDFSVNDLWA